MDRPLSLAELGEAEAILRDRYNAVVAGNVAAGGPAPTPPAVGSVAATIGEVKPQSGSGAAPYICYAAKPNSLLIRADGRIGKCTVALTDERNTIGQVNPDGTLTIDNDRLRPWVRGLATLDARALECPLSGLPQLLDAAAEAA